MPFQALSFRSHRRSDTDLRRHAVDPHQTRHSEQIPRQNESTERLPPHPAVSPLAARRSASPMVARDDSMRYRQSLLVPAHPETMPRSTRFSLLKLRNASDSQLAMSSNGEDALGAAATQATLLQPTPAIITTAPTLESVQRPKKKHQRLRLPGRHKAESESVLELSSQRNSTFFGKSKSESAAAGGSLRGGRRTFEDSRPPLNGSHMEPPPYGDEGNSFLALPVPRLSESSRSDGSSGEHVAYATTTTTHTVSTTTTFFRLSRKKKTRPSLFPLPAKPPMLSPLNSPRLPPDPMSSNAPDSTLSSPAAKTPAFQRASADPPHIAMSPLPSPSHLALAASSMNFAAPATPILRSGSTQSVRTTTAQPSLPPLLLSRKGRSATMGSLSRDDAPLPTPPLPSSRTSTSTIGRSGFGGIFSLSHRLRNNSEPPYPRNSSPAPTPGTPRSNPSQSNSLSISRDILVIPERQEDDTPPKYLVRLEEAVSRGVVASVISKSSDTFSQAVLRSYMRGFAFFGDPMDMAIRKLLMEVELPKETQQIDRVLQAFADRYHECNPGIYASPDQAYFIAFSLLILHTDVFNKNNKHKMQKVDYLRNTKDEGISDDILECFYDNISYTPFIHVEDDLDIKGERIIPHKQSRKTLFTRASSESPRKSSKEPVDPYTLIIDNNLDSLRPTLRDVMNVDDTYNYLGTANGLDLNDLNRTFFKSGVLQIMSARSRPEAFMSPTTITNPNETHPGVVDIKITKVGIIWRKDLKRKKTRSPWQEWGAILTGAQLYFFRNTTWVKNLIHQYDSHHRQGHAGIPVIFRPPLENFKPDALMSTDNAVALQDSSYKKHKNAFMFVRHGGFEETFLAESENEMNDWLAKLNYASAFRTAGVRMRGVVGGNYEGQRARGIRRMESSNSARSVQTPTGEVSILSGRIDFQLAQQILAARRQIMLQKISDAEEKLGSAQKQLEGQLRNARHLQILAPIQAKSREQVLLAAGRMAAQLKWVRMEIWRLRCHKDILSLDLEEEQFSAQDKQLRNQLLSGIIGSSLPASTDPPKVASTRPSTRSSSKEAEFTMEGIFQSPPEISRQSSHQPQASWELPPISFDADASASASGTLSIPILSPNPSQGTLAHHSSLPSIRSNDLSVDTVPNDSTLSPIPDDSPLEDPETELLKNAGIDPIELTRAETLRPKTPAETDFTKEMGRIRSPDTDLSEMAKVRSKLQRTLVSTHHRSRKGKDSASSAQMSEDGSISAEAEVLTRTTGSFTVHGKKASVVTFGSEWQNMSPDERKRTRKVPTSSDDAKVLTPLAVEDDDEELYLEAMSVVSKEI
ncbi:MAG: hypothetical protein M1829_001935 [Trizodia sp. TS-e1964]|nr:MAG: hypothetical protein M1829_001935 [Trizodia sp. TS-e1964]